MRTFAKVALNADDLSGILPTFLSFLLITMSAGQYMPNLVGGTPFALTRAFAERILAKTQSRIVQELLQNWVRCSLCSLSG
jgi:hypothetical protein